MGGFFHAVVHVELVRELRPVRLGARAPVVAELDLDRVQNGVVRGPDPNGVPNGFLKAATNISEFNIQNLLSWADHAVSESRRMKTFTILSCQFAFILRMYRYLRVCKDL